jgi:hypothetical protein
MALDPNIALGVRPLELPNQLAQYSQLSQIQNAQNQNALAQYQLGAAQRADEQQSNLYAAAKQPGFKLDAASAIQYGAPGIAAYKAQQDAANAQTEGQIKNTRLLADKLALLPEAYKRADTPEAYFALHKSVHADPVIGPWLLSTGATPEKGLAALQEAVQTGKFDDLRVKSMQSVGQILDGMKAQVVAPGSTLVQNGKAVFTAPAAPVAPAAPPSMVAEYTFAKTPDGGNFKGTYQEFVTARAAAGRAPAQPVAPTLTEVVDPKNPNQMLKVDARRYQGGGVGSPGVIGVGGKEPGAAVRANKAEEGKTQLADDLDNLRASFTRLDEMRAIPSTARNPLSNIASATAATGIGQTAGRFVGTEAQVEREVINSARTRLVNSIKNATGMSAQQLNSNVELQTMLKSISDPGQPIEAALRIIDDIDNAYVKGAGMSKKNAKPAASDIDALLNKYK